MSLYEQVKLNEIFNKMLDLLDREGVRLDAQGNYSLLMPTEKGPVRLWRDDVNRTEAYRDDLPPYDYDAFLNKTTDIFVQKNTDYDSRYTRALMATKDPAFLWAWEVEKKIDRIRSWVARGELLVKGEGVSNSVHDLFNYTVMYVMFNGCKEKGIDPLAVLKEVEFYKAAANFQPSDWVGLLETEGLIRSDEEAVKALILKYMGVANE